MLSYTLAFLKYEDKVLMINRQKSPWQGAWNGVGGKLEQGESPKDCVIREVWEETGIKLTSPVFRGIVTWNPDVEPAQGMYVFIANVSRDELTDLPRATREGILAFKDVSWVLSEDNFGTVPTIRFFMRRVLDVGSSDPADYHCTFEGNVIAKTEIRPLPEFVTI
ncbi:8-oxo-dGTP diphosphatase [Sporolactobacillus sp. STSJ-5]|uniref:NUDIX hydrolase n=1 Tax=Sporolactobacillus sp. STSJ-5 TaxID=2965076 RepID=UPI00210614B8|nr:8-oxo-dGTP diphosphatase [Sporolactobacillus sp. STSJ-5]MCQ2009413.1 8-oxo-dGTP diphosphatase [Sporolactobacillus sp. STSJ-5]